MLSLTVSVVVLLEARLALRALLLIFLITDETDSASASSGSLSTNTQKTIMVIIAHTKTFGISSVEPLRGDSDDKGMSFFCGLSATKNPVVETLFLVKVGPG